MSTPSQKCRLGSVEAPPELRPDVKRPNTQQGIPAAMVVDPHTRAIMEEDYRDSALNQHQLRLANEAVLAEIDKISSGPVPEFRDDTVRSGLMPQS